MTSPFADVIGENTVSFNEILLLEKRKIFNRSFELSHRAYVVENGKLVMPGKSKEFMNNDKVRES